MHRRLLDTKHDLCIRNMSFDTEMVIILAALLCALICGLVFNSIVRCALRYSPRFMPETRGLAATGLKKRDLKQIPVAVYGSDVNIEATECPICLGEFIDGEKVRILPKCNHSFHMKCIDTWLESHSSCPYCRRSLLENAEEDAGAQCTARQGTVVIVVDEAT